MENFSHLKSRIIRNINGLNINILENNVKKKKDNTILMLHGFPEISFSFRYLMKFFANKGFYCLAPDQRGYGKTISVKTKKLDLFSVINLTKDISALIKSLDINEYHLIGHDFGSYVSCYLSLLYPKNILSITTMSMPFSGPPNIKSINKLATLNQKLSKLKKKHYQHYFASHRAPSNIMKSRQGLDKFFRSYFHYKSYDYKKNKPFKLKNFSAKEMSKMPEYYIMKYNLGISQTVAKFMPSTKEINNCHWLNKNDLMVYVKNFSYSGMKQPLNWYKVMLSKKEKNKIIKLKLPNFTDIPAIFIAGIADWGIYQKPGDLEKMEKKFFKNYYGTKIIEGAGHWVQQEQPEKTFKEIIKFYKNF